MNRCFNSRSRVGSDRSAVSIPTVKTTFQFALPRGERPLASARFIVSGLVSIRAPAWGATPHRSRADRRAGVSIRAPAWGATAVFCFLIGFSLGFNSRSRVGSDSFGAADFSTRRVSIRAPAWGATWFALYMQMRAGSFNSRSRVGSDRAWQRRRKTGRRFNSRSRVGSDDCKPFYLQSFHMVSIRAPAWGATFSGYSAHITSQCFNSRSRVGSDARGRCGRCCPCRFNSRSRVGSDLFCASQYSYRYSFNSRSRVGSDFIL